MRAVVQRVTDADVSVMESGDKTGDRKITGAIKKGLVVFVGIENEDTSKDVIYMAEKIAGLRIFEDSDEKMNLSVKDVDGEILAISQFTLLGDVKKGKRPGFSDAARPEVAKPLYEEFICELNKRDVITKEGIFQADMLVRINNDGPVTILMDSNKKF